MHSGGQVRSGSCKSAVEGVSQSYPGLVGACNGQRLIMMIGHGRGLRVCTSVARHDGLVAAEAQLTVLKTTEGSAAKASGSAHHSLTGGDSCSAGGRFTGKFRRHSGVAASNQKYKKDSRCA